MAAAESKVRQRNTVGQTSLKTDPAASSSGKPAASGSMDSLRSRSALASSSSSSSPSSASSVILSSPSASSASSVILSSLSASSATSATSASSVSLSSSSTSKIPLAPRPNQQLTRAQLARRIANGESLVLRGRTIYKLDSWLSKHPGGPLAILHFVGRDASDEIEAYHSEETLRKMRVFAVATLAEEDWLGDQGKGGKRQGYKPLVPPVQLGYRNGKLDHPTAHEDLWSRQRQASKQRISTTVAEAAIAAADSTQPPGTVTTQDMLESARGLSPEESSDSGFSSSEDDEQASQSDGDLARPQCFPLPVKLLEPPPNPEEIDPTREKDISIAYKELHKRVKAAGLYELRPIGYVRECARYLSLAAISFGLWYYADGRTSYFLASSFFLGLFWHQLTFTAHDAGHLGITHKYVIDRTIGVLIADFIGGLSIGWWCDNHDVHHLVTNHPEHDPDIQHMPFFAISPKFLVWQKDSSAAACGGDGEDQGDKNPSKSPAALGLWSSYYRRVLCYDAPSRFFLSLQHNLYYVVMSLGRFNLYANSYSFLALKSRRDRFFYLELLGLATFWTWYTLLLLTCPTWSTSLSYLLISHVVTSPLHVQITLSHFGQSSADLGLSESFASRQVRTTMDVQCPPWLDFLHGGLHMQVSHHLFPRVPRHNLRRLRDEFVRPFCRDVGLQYEEMGFLRGNKKVLAVLKDVADQVAVLGKVAQAQARGEIHAH